MIQIRIKWTNVSPFLRTLSGIVEIVEITHNSFNEEILLSFKVDITPNSIGYQSFKDNEGIPTKLFKKYKPIIDIMANSYRRGVTLDQDDYYWVEKDVGRFLY